jgi:hypothetical protein
MSPFKIQQLQVDRTEQRLLEDSAAGNGRGGGSHPVEVVVQPGGGGLGDVRPVLLVNSMIRGTMLRNNITNQ